MDKKQGGRHSNSNAGKYENNTNKRDNFTSKRDNNVGNRAGNRDSISGIGSRNAIFAAEIGQNELEVTPTDFIFGRNPVTEALRSGRDIEKIYIASGSEGSISKIVALARDSGTPFEVVPRAHLDRLAQGEKHQGVAAQVSAYRYFELDDILLKAQESEEAPFIVILDGINDPHNLGAIMRTAECVGAHGIVIPRRRACGLTATVAKSSAGAIERIPVVRVPNIARAIEFLQKKGVWVAAVDMDGDTYYKQDLKGAIAIVIGSEGSGISRLVKEKCDFCVSIPMRGNINSLNASNAAAVVMYGIRRERDS